MSDKKECPVCYDELDETSVKLKCGHSFHYNCILNSYKSINKKNKIRYLRLCPYCRLDGGYLELKKNNYPIKGIHYEYYAIEKYIIMNDFEKVKEMTKDYLNPKKCNAIIKSGINKGYQCKMNKKNNEDYCYHHK